MTTITFYKTLKGEEETISDIHYEKLCKIKKDIFESIPDDKPVKMYFDADYVFYSDDSDKYFKAETANEILNLNKAYLTKALTKTLGIEPEYAVAESHSRGRVKSGKNVWGYSFHIVIPNVVAYKKDMKNFTDILNNEIIQDQKFTENPYSDYIIDMKDDFQPFDTSVYNSGKQKFRTVHSSKDGEDRPFNMLEGTFQDMCITGFIGDDATKFIPYIGDICDNKKEVIHYEPKTIKHENKEIVTTEDSDNLFQKLAYDKQKKDDMLFVKLAVEKEMLISRSKDTEKWMATSLFLKGYFGDNTDSIDLFHSFSKLYSAKFDERLNMEKWDGFVVNDKYDNFGIFVNWCKEENKDKCKEIKNEVKQIIKDNSDRIKKELKEASDEKKRIIKEALEQAKIKNKEASDNLKLKNKEAINSKKEEDRIVREANRIRKEEDRIKKEELKSKVEKQKQEKIENGEKGEKLFEEMSAKFELEHTKIINGSIYVKQVDDRVVFMSRRDMMTSYEHIQCGYNILGFPVSFIERWMVNNKSINVKDSMDIYPDVENCPPNVFNLWRPFEMEKYKTPYQQHNDELKIILNHILILCGNDKAMYNYFIGWISKMIQQPHIKLTCMVFISKQGAGKGTLVKLFSKMLGKNRAYEPTNPSRDVWGNFNDLMTDAFLVNINELEYNDAKKGESQFKALITDPNITINPKGQKPIWVKSHHHFIITTNKENPIPIEKGNRRFVVVKSSDEKCKDTDYFTQIHDIMENIDVIRTAYDYFKNYDISEYEHTKFPVTEYLEDLMVLNTCAPELWLKDFTAENITQSTIELLGGEIFARFSLWCNTNNVVYDTNPIKLALKIKNLNINGIDKGRETNKGNTKIFDIQKMKKHFNIGCLVEL
jgi:Family of unknown function (DUF5906)